MQSTHKKFVDFRKLVTRVWLILWAILGILLIMKYCFNLWYPVVVENETFINICNYIDNTKWLECLLGSFFYLFSINIWVLICIKRYKYKNIFHLIIINVIVVGCYLVKYFIDTTIANFIELLFLIIYPIVFNIKTKNLKNRKYDILLPIAVYIIINIFQLNILLVRNIKQILSELPSLIYTVMQLDYYIFLIIMWIGVNLMGWLTGGWFFGKSLTELEAMKAEELKNENPDKIYLNELDKAIEEKKKEEK